MGGAYVSQHLSFLVYVKAVRGQAKVRTGLGKSDPTVRDRRGAYGNVGYGSRTEAHWETSG